MKLPGVRGMLNVLLFFFMSLMLVHGGEYVMKFVSYYFDSLTIYKLAGRWKLLILNRKC